MKDRFRWRPKPAKSERPLRLPAGPWNDAKIALLIDRLKSEIPEGAIYVLPQVKRYETARRWAGRRTKEELVHVISMLFQRRAEDQLELGCRYLSEEEAPARARRKVASKGAASKLEKNPTARAKYEAMAEIRAEWERCHRPGGKFAAGMARQCQQQGIDISEGSIKNAITRWRKES